MSFQVFQAQGLRIYTGDTATVNQYVGLAGELAITTDNKSIRILDGINPGGTPLTTANGAELQGLNIEQLANLLVSAPQDGQALVYEGGKWKNKDVAASGSGGASHVNDLVDVKLTNLQTGEVLSYNASIMKWENKAVAAADHNHDSKYQLKGNYLRDTSNLGEVNDVQITMPANGQSLVYDAGKWINTTVAEGSGSVDGITSVNGNIGIGTNSPTNNTILHIKDTNTQIKLESTNGSNDGFINFDGTNLQLSTNRNMIDGVFSNTGKSNATIILSGASAGSDIRMYTASGNNTVATERMCIDSSGKVGIGTAPATALHVKSTSPVVYLQDSNAANTTEVSSYLDFMDQNDNRAGFIGFASRSNHYFYIDNRSSDPFRYSNNNGSCDIGPKNSSWFHFYTDRPNFYFNKQCQSTGGFTTYSDERLKENVTVVENAVDALKKIRGVSFTWRTNVDSQERREGKMFGVLAQEVLQIDPEMCEQPEAAIDGDEKYYTFDYSNLTPYFIEAIKEQQVTIESQQAKIDSLEARLAALEAKLS